MKKSSIQKRNLAEMIFADQPRRSSRTDRLMESMDLNEGVVDFFKNIFSDLKKAWTTPAWQKTFDEEMFKEKGLLVPQEVDGKPFEELNKSTKELITSQLAELMAKVEKATGDVQEAAKAVLTAAEALKDGKKPEEAINAGFKEVGVDPQAAVGDSRSSERLEKALGKMPDMAMKHFERSYDLVKTVDDAKALLNWFVDQFPEEKSSLLKKAYRDVKKEL
jgi:hypothetical protein